MALIIITCFATSSRLDQLLLLTTDFKMRSRSNSGIRLDLYYRMTSQSILKYQHHITGLISSSKDNHDAWVRDNVYSICAVWGLALAYRKTADVDEDRAKAYELEQSVVKLMRGLLMCMMRQVKKVEQFKQTQSPKNSLHAKYSSEDGGTVVSDEDWGHLQIDATSLYLLMLAQMTASGLYIIYTLDEVAFVQNLIFYIESAYRIPDYGIWERGDKTNHGLPELNASSIGLAKAAMEAMAGLDLFGSNGSALSTIQVHADKVAQCNAILQSLLPRESSSKEVDSALLSVIGFPAFAVDDQQLVNLTRETILNKCLGRYGCCRFLRDGHKTAVEDASRLHYELWELQKFENIECEWPVFLAYLSINESFCGNKDKASDYISKAEKLLVPGPGGRKIMPEMYAVPANKVKDEYNKPGSQDRVAVGQIPHKWGDSLYILSRLLSEGFISPSEIDPLNRRLAVLPKPDLVVQMVVLAENEMIQKCLATMDMDCHTFSSFQQDGKYVLHNAKVLEQVLSHLGECDRFGLTGRRTGVGLLTTSTLYRYGDCIYCFPPELYDNKMFYLAMDLDFVLDKIRTDLQYLKANWQMLGRPTVILPIYNWMSDFSGEVPGEFQRAFIKIKSGYHSGVRVQLGDINDFLSTSCVTSLDWLKGSAAEMEVVKLLGHTTPDIFRVRLPSGSRRESLGLGNSVKGIIKRGIATTQTTSVGVGGETTLCVQPATGMLKVPSRSHFPISLPGSASNSDLLRQQSYEMVEVLMSSDDLSEQADILHYLFITKGPDYKIRLDNDKMCSVNVLLEQLYHEAGNHKVWWLIRYTAGMLKKRALSLASALSDLLVRQKQVTFGLPPQKERIVANPLPPELLANTIQSVCMSPSNNAEKFRAVSPHCMLHQELLVSLAMFVRTEPELFHGMLRVRIGLIISVMSTELSRCLNCSASDATSHLLNLSPYELKNFLHHILSGREFVVEEEEFQISIVPEQEHEVSSKRKSVKHRIFSPSVSQVDVCRDMFDMEKEDTCEESSGQWSRRRRIDGALNRAPVGFYSKIWHLLKQCQGLSIEGEVLSQNLIQEMTEEELKFALKVESVLNRVPEPEYRQLMVEALISLTMISQLSSTKGHCVDKIIPVNDIVTKAYMIYLHEQGVDVAGHAAASKDHHCHRLRGICEAFYDTAPSGTYGTITYMCRALPEVVQLPAMAQNDGSPSDCQLQ